MAVMKKEVSLGKVASRVGLDSSSFSMCERISTRGPPAIEERSLVSDEIASYLVLHFRERASLYSIRIFLNIY